MDGQQNPQDPRPSLFPLFPVTGTTAVVASATAIATTAATTSGPQWLCNPSFTSNLSLINDTVSSLPYTLNVEEEDEGEEGKQQKQQKNYHSYELLEEEKEDEEDSDSNGEKECDFTSLIPNAPYVLSMVEIGWLQWSSAWCNGKNRKLRPLNSTRMVLQAKPG
ncbi:Uncharacterized protein TCM_011662 [Theobroma cacao]|uniref:Uncharacterized protein n=1 Tax=Theobroma cacao TaxID=3641 RepID=A0A061EA82_THECC|nr:Uncharacterized protein TCM_011662 [Theobroma cacao]